MILCLGAFLGLISVAFGAYAKHALGVDADDSVLVTLDTALRYNQIYAVVVTAIGLAMLNDFVAANYPRLAWAAYGFVLGTVLFSFSAYVSIVSGFDVTLQVMPYGGITLIVSWVLLGIIGIRSRG